MARCRITKAKTLRRLSERVGVRVVTALTRGNTGSRIDAQDETGTWWHCWPDGTTEKSEDIPWSQPPLDMDAIEQMLEDSIRER